jgi:hypothetical protein
MQIADSRLNMLSDKIAASQEESKSPASQPANRPFNLHFIVNANMKEIQA